MISMALTATLTALSLTGQAGAVHPLEWGRGPLTIDSLPRIVYTAHRGGALEVPENSMSGLMTAYGRGTSQVLDVDTRVLKDGTLVAFHDRTLDRTTNMSGPVKELTRSDWERVRLVPPDGMEGAWRPERPPTVEEVLDRFGGRIILTLELKDADGLDALSRILRERELERSVFVNSHSPKVAERVHDLGLMAQLWRSAKEMSTDKPRDWLDFVDVLDVNYKAPDKDLVRAASSGIPRVWAHTVNSPEERDRVLRLGFTGVITDAPGLLSRTPATGAYAIRPLSEG